MPTLSLGTIDLFHDERGAGEPLVLVHGFTGSSLDWADVVDGTAATHRVVTYDHRGHGRSTNTGDAATYRLEQLVDDLEGLVAGLGLRSFHLLGHSMGGFVAMRYALRHPDHLRSLVLMDTSGASLGGGNQFFAAASALASEGGTMAVFEMLEPFLPVADDRGRLLRDRTREKYEQMDPVAFVELARELQDAPSLLAPLAGLAVPTTVLVGENDQPFRAPCDALAATIPGARLVVQAGAGHCPHEDDPTTWMATMHDHLHRAANVG